MSISDRLRAWLRGETKRRSAPSPSTDEASRGAMRELEEFARSRNGVEAYLEPKTAIYSTTIVLIADDGEYLRRPVKDAQQGRGLAKRLSIPIYDAAKMGYPRRMRDYHRGAQPPRRIELSDLPPWPGDDDPGGTTPDGPPPPPTGRG